MQLKGQGGSGDGWGDGDGCGGVYGGGGVEMAVVNGDVVMVVMMVELRWWK